MHNKNMMYQERQKVEHGDNREYIQVELAPDALFEGGVVYCRGRETMGGAWATDVFFDEVRHAGGG